MVSFDEVVLSAFKKEVSYPKNEVQEIINNPVLLARKGILFREEGENIIFGRHTFFKRKSKDLPEHKYILPSFTDEVLALLRCAKDTNFKSKNIALTGPKGTGKTEFVYEIAKMAGFSKVFQVNGREDMDSSDFFGDKTVVIDKESKQNKIIFNKGPLYQAFIEGTELDENGDQILYDADGKRTYDESGIPKVVGAPAIFFLDEFAAVLPGVLLSVFNRTLEIPRVAGKSRTIEITADGGRVVKSHPGFVVFFAGNTVGKGTESESQMGYTAQNNLMDDSTLDRISATYKFGYNLKAEHSIMLSKLHDEYMVYKLEDFRDEIRKMWREGKVETLLSTRAIVSICDQALSFEEIKRGKGIPLAIFRSVFTGLRDREKSGWNEVIRYKFGVDVLNEFQEDNNVWYPNK